MKTLAPEAGVYRLDFFGDKVLAVFSGRRFPADRRPAFLKALGLKPKQLFLLKQIHSANLIRIREGQSNQEVMSADGMLTSQAGAGLGILTADCVPVFFWDPERRAAAIVHAGWRGTYQGIAAKMVQAFRQNFASRSGEIRVILGPAIRECCYEVGEEFAEMFPDFYRSGREGFRSKQASGRMDLAGALNRQLAQEGILPENVFDTGICTYCSKERLFSARRESGTSERILSVIRIGGP